MSNAGTVIDSIGDAMVALPVEIAAQWQAYLELPWHEHDGGVVFAGAHACRAVPRLRCTRHAAARSSAQDYLPRAGSGAAQSLQIAAGSRDLPLCPQACADANR